jgi:polysaccharide biosynthesis/export protein PslD
MMDRRRILWGVLGAAVAASTAGCASGQSRSTDRVQRGGFSDIAFADWTDAEPEYVLYPGDEIDVALPTASELNRSLRVGPDGRIALPLVGQAMAADRTLAELEYTLSEAYASQLVRPVVEITLKQAGPIQVWVAGEVRTPGVIALTGDLDAYQAIVQAGDFLATAKPQEVALIRRGPGGVRMMRVIDLRPRRGEVVALRRGDILYVPRSTLGELANFFTQVRNALPIGFNYSINGQYQSF